MQPGGLKQREVVIHTERSGRELRLGPAASDLGVLEKQDRTGDNRPQSTFRISSEQGLVMHPHELLAAYGAGPGQLRRAVSGMSAEQVRARPVAGKWSVLEVVCHLADFEPIYADRMKRVLAEDEPLMLSGDPDRFASKLAYHQRDLEEELRLIETVRGQMGRILQTVADTDWQRCGRHSSDGLIPLRTLLERVTGHIGHHLPFLAEKRAALGLG